MGREEEEREKGRIERSEGIQSEAEGKRIEARQLLLAAHAILHIRAERCRNRRIAVPTTQAVW